MDAEPVVRPVLSRNVTESPFLTADPIARPLLSRNVVRFPLVVADPVVRPAASRMVRHDGVHYSGEIPLSRHFNVIKVPKRKRGPLIGWFDHRVLQGAYNTIAAAFRCDNPDLCRPPFSEDEVVKDISSSAWKTFWEAEVNRLVQNDKIIIAVLIAVAFQNQENGLAAEMELAELLCWEYPAFTLARDRENKLDSDETDVADDNR